MQVHKLFLVGLPAVVFLIISVTTLSHYGIIWDEPDHFYRGQAYLNYFLTGSTDYSNLDVGQRSFYQNDLYSAEYFFYKDEGHPPLNGILAALTNYIFYQKLGILGDLEALHLFGVLASVLLVLIVSLFAYQTYGLLASLVATVSLAAYPLFFGEAHFNVKDPVEAAFFGLTIWAFWMSLKVFNWKWLLLSVISFAVALSTKFNILFLPFIIGPYLWILYSKNIPRTAPKSFKLTLLISPLIVLIIFIGCWPYLWKDLGGLLQVASFYLERGLTGGEEAGIFLPGKINLYPLIWIMITTPVWVLFLAVLGIIFAFREKRQDRVTLLWILWLIVPILRVTIPYARTYGGVRQLMEYIPALALLAGLGASKLKDWMSNKLSLFKSYYGNILLSVIILLIFIPHILVLIKLHPNENVYFNILIGGISGAKKANIPYWGNSFGNAYLQGIWWLNKNAPKGAHLALLQKVNTNIDPTLLRQDIKYQAGETRSGIRREGEYIMELTHQGAMHYYPYMWEYVNKFLEPVFTVQVDKIAIAKVWKNDLEHTKAEMRFFEKEQDKQVLTSESKSMIVVKASEEVLISRIQIEYDHTLCGPVMGRVQTSLDETNWFDEDEYLHSQQLPDKKDASGNIVNFYFAARYAREVKLLIDRPNPCLFKNPRIHLFVLK